MEYDNLQRELKNKIEAQDQAAQRRISSFYKTNTGKMVPTTFLTLLKKSTSLETFFIWNIKGDSITTEMIL